MLVFGRPRLRTRERTRRCSPTATTLFPPVCSVPLPYALGLEAPHGFYLVRLLADGQSTRDFGGTSAIHDTIIPDEVPDDTQGIVKGSLCFLDDLEKTVPQKLTLAQSSVLESNPRRLVEPLFARYRHQSHLA